MLETPRLALQCLACLVLAALFCIEARGRDIEPAEHAARSSAVLFTAPSARSRAARPATTSTDTARY